MTVALDQECQQLRSKWAARAAALREEAKAAVTQAMWQYGRQGQWYQKLEECTEQATAIARGLADAEIFGLAAKNLGWIAKQVDAYDKDGRNPQLVLKALVLQGVAQVRTNDGDGGVAKIAYAAEQRAGTSLDPWVEEHLTQFFEAPGAWLFSGTAGYPGWVKTPEQHVNKAFELLGPQKYAGMAAIQTIFRVAGLHYETPSSYTRLRLLDAYRSLTTSIEALAKAIGKTSLDPGTANAFGTAKRITLNWALDKLTKHTPACNYAEAIMAKLPGKDLTIDPNDPATSLSEKLAIVRGQPRDSVDKLLGQALIATRLVRNFAAHETTFGEALSDHKVHASIGELTIAAFVYLPYMCQQAGHLEKFWHD